MADVWSAAREVLSSLLCRIGATSRERRELPQPFHEIAPDGESLPLWSTRASEAKVLFVVTTCERVTPLRRLLEQLSSSLSSAALTGEAGLLVIEDPSADDYTPLRREMYEHWGERVLWVRAQHRMGKSGFFHIYQAAFSYAQRSKAEKVFFLQDDLEMNQETIPRSLQLLSMLREGTKPEPRPLVLNLYASGDDEPGGRWVKFNRIRHSHLPLYKTQWFDLNGYVMERAALELLRYQVIPIEPSRWRCNPLLSSGVGRQLSQRLSQKADIYQCFPPLIFHGTSKSVMNPGARTLRNLDNYHLRGEAGEGSAQIDPKAVTRVTPGLDASRAAKG